MPNTSNHSDDDDYDPELDEILPVHSNRGNPSSSRQRNERQRIPLEHLPDIAPALSNRRHIPSSTTVDGRQQDKFGNADNADDADVDYDNGGDNDDDNDDEDDEMNEESISDKLSSYFDLLSTLDSQGSSRQREICQYVYKVLNWNEGNGLDKVRLTTKACKLYIELLYRIQQVSYDDIVYSTCFHKMTRMVKEASTFKSGASSKKILHISTDEKIPLADYAAFWVGVVNRFHDHYLNNSSLVAHLIHAFMQLLKYAAVQSVLQIVSIMFDKLLQKRHGSQVLKSVITTIYKNGYQLLLSNLPTANRNLLVQVLTNAARKEPSCFRTNEDSDDDDVDRDEAAEEENDENLPDRNNSIGNEDVDNGYDAVDNANDADIYDADDVVMGDAGESEELQKQRKQAKTRKKSRSDAERQREQYPRPIIVLFKVCIEQVADKAIVRAGLSQAMYAVISDLTGDYHERFVTILLQCAIHKKVSARLVTIDVASRLLARFCNSGADENSGAVVVQMQQKLVAVLVGRCKDRMGSVRSKAISSLLEVLTTEDRDDLFNSSTLDDFVTGLKLRVRDEKSTVRKSVVQFIGYALKLMLVNGNENMQNTPTDMFNMLMNRCGDIVPSVRLAAGNQIVSVLDDLLKNGGLWKDDVYGTNILVDAMQHVLQLFDDVDNRCRVTCLNLVRNMVTMDDNEGLNNDNKICTLFYCMVSGHNRIITRLCERALHSLCKDDGGALTQSDVAHIFNQLGTCDDEGANNAEDDNATDANKLRAMKKGIWITLAAIAMGGMEQDVWRTVGADTITGEITTGKNGQACKIALAHVAHMDDAMKASLKAQLLSVLFRRDHGRAEQRSISEGIITATNGGDKEQNSDSNSSGDVEDNGSGDDVEGQVSVICEVIGRLHGDDECGDRYLERCENELIERDNASKEDVVHALSVIGNICQWMPLQQTPSDRLLAYVERMTMSEQTDATHKRIGALALVCLGRICLCETQVVTSSSTAGGRGQQQQQATQQRGTVRKGQKIGESLTRRFISMFVHQLDNANSRATRSNAVTVICDLCRKYTTLVEPFMTRVAAVMSDESWFVRHQAISSLLNLLQEDYIKVRPGTFVLLQTVKSVIDPHPEVRNVVEYALQHIIVVKNRTCLSTCFVQLVAMLTGCDEHSDVLAQFSGVLRPDIETAGKSDEVRKRRAVVYDRVLAAMPREQRVRLPGRLVNDVAAAVAEGKWTLDTQGVDDMLYDVLKLLPSPKVNLFSRRGGPFVASVAMVLGDYQASASQQQTESQQQEDAGNNGNNNNNSNSVAVNHMMLRNVQMLELRECIIPVLIELRQVLQNKRSPVLGPLHTCLCELLQPHRENIGQFIPDGIVRAQIVHEIQRGGQQQETHEQQQQQQEQEQQQEQRGEQGEQV